MKAECQAFLDAIASGGTPLTSGEEGLRVLKILELSQHSLEAKERGSWQLEPLPLDREPRTDFFAHPTARHR